MLQSTKLFLFLGASVLTLGLFCSCARAPAKKSQGSMVRIAEVEIDPAQLEHYKAELREEIEASIRQEPGVLTLYAVSLKENPSSIRILETYADVDAYKAHIESPHFKKYKTNTEAMVKSLKLIETDPILLGAK
jgi:quinol monooxygenase YgiN